MRLMDLPDRVLADFLVRQRGFSEKGAKRCVRNFRSSMAFAGLDQTSDWEREARWDVALRKSQQEAADD